MKKLLTIFSLLAAIALPALASDLDYAYRIPAELQITEAQALGDLTWQQGSTPLIQVEVLRHGKPVTAETNMTVRMIIGPSGTNQYYVPVAAYLATNTSYYIQWPTVGTNTVGTNATAQAWWYTIYFERNGYRYWTGNGDLYIERTTSTDPDGLVWQTFTDQTASWSNIVGNISNNSALMAEFAKKASVNDLAGHTTNKSNPHDTTAFQVGAVATSTPAYLNLLSNTATKAQGAKADTALQSEADTNAIAQLSSHAGLTGTSAHGLGSASLSAASAFATSTQGNTADAAYSNSSEHIAKTTNAHGGIIADTDPRLTDSRDPNPHNQDWTTVTGKPNSVSGYGITDAFTKSESDLRFASSGNVTGVESDLSNHKTNAGVHAIAAVTGLQAALDGKSPTGHVHVVDNVTGLQDALDGKAGTGDVAQARADIEDLQGLTNSIIYATTPGYTQAAAQAAAAYPSNNPNGFVTSNVTNGVNSRIDGLTNGAALGVTALQPGASGTWTNLSDYNNDLPGASTNLSDFNNDVGFLTNEASFLAWLLDNTYVQSNTGNWAGTWQGLGTNAFATAAQGTKADTALQAEADTNALDQLSTHTNTPAMTAHSGLGTAATNPASAFASSNQGARADTAHGWGDHSTNNYSTGTPVYAESDPNWAGKSNQVQSDLTSLSTGKVNRADTNGWEVGSHSGLATGTPLYVESDPTFSVSVAASITSGDTDRWNAGATNANAATNDIAIIKNSTSKWDAASIDAINATNDISAHTTNDPIHVSTSDRTNWDGKTTMSEVEAKGYQTNDTYLGTITGATIVTGAVAGVTTSGPVLNFTVPSGVADLSGWSGWPATQQISHVASTGSVPTISNLVVSGTLSPDATGVYTQMMDLNGAPCFHNSNDYYAAYSGLAYVLTPNANGTPPESGIFWAKSTDVGNPEGVYEPIGTNTGNATGTYQFGYSSTWKHGYNPDHEAWEIERNGNVIRSWGADSPAEVTVGTNAGQAFDGAAGASVSGQVATINAKTNEWDNKLATNGVNGTNTTGTIFVNGQATEVGANTPWTNRMLQADGINVSNRMGVVETNTFPLESGLSVSNDIATVKTNYYPLQDGIAASNLAHSASTNAEAARQIATNAQAVADAALPKSSTNAFVATILEITGTNTIANGTNVLVPPYKGSLNGTNGMFWTQDATNYWILLIP